MAFRWSEREQLDTVLLVCAFLLGVGLALGLKWLGFHPAFPALASAAVIIGYAVLTYKSSAARLEPEQVGDNAYYLGFCITLSSLAFTLTQLSSAEGQAEMLNDVIAGFGLALSSTIVGVMTRVVLLQFRVDLAARDKEARTELNQVMREFHTELHNSVTSSVEASTQIRQSLQEYSEDNIALNERMQTRFEQRLDSMSTSAASAAKAGISDVIADAEQAVGRLNSSFHLLGDELEKTMKDCFSVVTEVKQNLSSNSAQMLADREELLRVSSDQLADNMKLISEGINSSLTEIASSSRMNLESVDKALSESMAGVNAEFKKTTESFQQGIKDVNKSLQSSLKGVSTEVSSVVKTAGDEAQNSIRKTSDAYQADLTFSIKALADDIGELVEPLAVHKGQLRDSLDAYAEEAHSSRVALASLVSDSRTTKNETLETHRMLVDASETINEAANALIKTSREFANGQTEANRSLFGRLKR